MADHAVPVRPTEPDHPAGPPAHWSDRLPRRAGPSFRIGAWLPALVAVAGVVTGLVLRALGFALPLTGAGGR